MSSNRTVYELVAAGDIEAVKSLIKLGLHHEVIKNAPSCNYTPLLISIEKGHYETVKLLLKNGVDCNGNTTTYYSYLTFALFYLSNPQQQDIILLLIESGADLAHSDVKNRIPLIKNDALLSLINNLITFKQTKQAVNASIIADSYDKLGKPEKKAEWDLIAANLGHADSIQNVIQTLIKNGNYPEAFTWFKKSVPYQQKTIDLFEQLAKQSIMDAKESKDIKLSSQLQLDICGLLIDYYINNNNLSKAEELLIQTKKLTQTFSITSSEIKPDINTMLASFSGEQQQAGAIISLIKNLRLLAESKETRASAKLEHAIGLRYAELKKPEEAAKFYCLAAEHGNYEGMLNHVDLLLEQKKVIEAIQWLEKSVLYAGPTAQQTIYTSPAAQQTILQKLEDIAAAKEGVEKCEAYCALSRIHMLKDIAKAIDYSIQAKSIIDQVNNFSLTDVDKKFYQGISKHTIYTNKFKLDSKQDLACPTQSPRHLSCVPYLVDAALMNLTQAIDILKRHHFVSPLLDVQLAAHYLNTGTRHYNATYSNFIDGLIEMYGWNNNEPTPQKAIKTLERLAATQYIQSELLPYIYLHIGFGHYQLALAAVNQEDKHDRINKAVQAFNKLLEFSPRQTGFVAGEAMNLLFNLLTIADEMDQASILKSILSHYQAEAAAANPNEFILKEVFAALKTQPLFTSDLTLWKLLLNAVNDAHKTQQSDPVRQLLIQQLNDLASIKDLSTPCRYYIETTLTDCCSRHTDKALLSQAIKNYELAQIHVKDVKEEKLAGRADLYKQYAGLVAKDTPQDAIAAYNKAVDLGDCEAALLEAKIAKTKQGTLDIAIKSCQQAMTIALKNRDEKNILAATEQAIDLKNNFDLSFTQLKVIEETVASAYNTLRDMSIYSQHPNLCERLYEYAQRDRGKEQVDREFKLFVDTLRAKQVSNKIKSILDGDKDNILPQLVEEYAIQAKANNQNECASITNQLQQYIVANLYNKLFTWPLTSSSDTNVIAMQKSLIVTIEQSLLKQYQDDKSDQSIRKIGNLYITILRSTHPEFSKTGEKRTPYLQLLLRVTRELYFHPSTSEYMKKALKGNLKRLMKEKAHPIIIKQAQQFFSEISLNNEFKNKKTLKIAARDNYIPAVYEAAKRHTTKRNWLGKKRQDRPTYLFAKFILLSLSEPVEVQARLADKVVEANQYLDQHTKMGEFFKKIIETATQLIQSANPNDAPMKKLLKYDPDAYILTEIKNYPLLEKLIVQTMDKAYLGDEKDVRRREKWVTQKKLFAEQMLEEVKSTNHESFLTNTTAVNEIPSAPEAADINEEQPGFESLSTVETNSIEGHSMEGQVRPQVTQPDFVKWSTIMYPSVASLTMASENFLYPVSTVIPKNPEPENAHKKPAEEKPQQPVSTHITNETISIANSVHSLFPKIQPSSPLAQPKKKAVAEKKMEIVLS